MNAKAIERPVVVGVDSSDGALDALRWAARYANEARWPLRLVHAMTVTDAAGSADPVVPGPFGVASIGLHRPGRSCDRLLAAALAEAARHAPQLQISVRTASDTPVAALVDASSKARLLVVGSNGRGRWVTLFDSVTSRIVAAAHSPVVVVRGDVDPAGPVVVADNVRSGARGRRLSRTRSVGRAAAWLHEPGPDTHVAMPGRRRARQLKDALTVKLHPHKRPATAAPDSNRTSWTDSLRRNP